MTHLLRVATINFSTQTAEAIAKNVINAFKGKYEWYQILEPIKEEYAKKYLLHKEAEGYPADGYFKANGLMKFLHENYFSSVLCLTNFIIIDDASEEMLYGRSEALNPFGYQVAKSFISTSFPELSSSNHQDIQVQRISINACHELGHLWGLDDHQTEKRYADNGRLCTMTTAHKTNEKDMASRIKFIESRDMGFCKECYSLLL